MKKRMTVLKKMWGIALAAVVISMAVPNPVLAEEAAGNEITVETENCEAENPETEGPETDSPEAEDPETVEKPDTDMPEEDGAEPDDSDDNMQDPGGSDVNEPDPEEQDIEEPGDSEPGTEEPEGGESDGEEPDGSEQGGGQPGPEFPPVTIPPMAVMIPMDPSDAAYAELSQLLTRISDRFQVYTVAVVDPMTQQPVTADEPVDVSLAIPADYDKERTFIKEIKQTADAQGVSWDDVAYRSENGKALFGTDHSGLFVVIEIPDTPGKLEMTSKVDRLELTKAYPSGTFPVSLKYSTVIPLTGDDNSVFIWGGVTVLAAAAVVAGIIIIIKRRK